MKAFPLAAAVLICLLACTTEPTEGIAENNEALDMANAGNGVAPPGPAQPQAADEGSGLAEGGDEGSQASPPVRDGPIKGPQSRPASPSPADEACGASRYKWLVGRPRSAIPPPPEGARWRVTCTGCPVTMDYSPARLNIFYDSETERVEEVRCG